MSALPAGAVERFALKSLQIDGNLAYITWNVGDDPAWHRHFLRGQGKIVSQTFAMYAAPVK